jgi:hypothetical protein
VPIGVWSTFANHGTVNKFTFGYYNADHHGPAIRVTEDAMRQEGAVSPDQDVVNAYGNSDEGDMTAGIARSGPADAEWVGRREANAMLAAWRDAGRHLSATPTLEQRWTRFCFCGQTTEGGMVDSQAVFGEPQLTGSEEGRGPLYDNTHMPLEGQRSPNDDPVQGDKIGYARPPSVNVPRAVPVIALRVGDLLVVRVPGEMTVGMGERLRNATLAATRSAGIARVVISGLANEYLSYYTTPEEYQAQHYEGGSTLYGRYSSNLVRDVLVDLARRLAGGQPAPDAYPYDPTNSVTADAAPFDQGAGTSTATAQPQTTPRLGHAEFRWAGGQRGLDRPVDRAFVTIERHVAGRWQATSDDLGLQVLWSVDDQGGYRALWEAPRDAPAGTYRFVVTANRYRLQSSPFDVAPSSALTVARGETSNAGVTLTLDYPPAVPEQDFTYRPRSTEAGTMTVSVDGRGLTVHGHNGAFVVPARPGSQVSVAAGAANDGFANTNARALSFSP